jgi:chromosomal replication initiation ATPase DnaA
LSQLSFPFQTADNKNSFSEEEFLLLTENSSAFNFLNKFFGQNNWVKSQFPSLILKGAKESGKTHLLHIFAKKFGAEFLAKEIISEINPTHFFVADNFYIIENIDQIPDEELVLRLVNSAVEARAFLILSLTNSKHFGLKDLSSRLKNIFAVEIKNPSFESVKQLLAKGFASRQIKLSRAVIDFISENIDRNYQAIFAALKLVEFHTQEKGKSLTIADAKKIFSYLKGNLEQL